MTRGPRWTRRTTLAYSKVTSHGSISPVTGAALAGSGVHARGRWPSPANSPEVGSRPIQPAPGTYTSLQAWRSVKSADGPGRALERGLVRLELDQVARHEAGGQAQAAQDLREQPGAVPAGAETLFEGLLRGLDPGLEPGGVGHRLLDPLVDADQEVNGGARPAAGPRPRPAMVAGGGPARPVVRYGRQIPGQARRRSGTGSARHQGRGRSRTG